MDNVTPIRNPVTATIDVDKDTAGLLLELVSKAAVTGPQARLLADLYDQAVAAVKFLAHEA